MDANRAGESSLPAAGISSVNVSFASPQSSIVSSLSATRVVNILIQNGFSSSSLLVDGDGSLDLTRLKLKQLKAVSKSLNTAEEDFNMPKSGARKIEWVNAIADFFRLSLDNGVRTSAAKARRSPAKAASQKASNDRKPAAKRTTATSTNSIHSDEAMAKALQQQYMQDDMNQLMGFGGALASNASLLTNTLSYNVAARHHPLDLPNDASVAGLKRPANPRSAASNNAKQPKHAPVKVKKEPYHHATSTSSHSLPHEEDGDRPRDARESSLVETMRSMGFTDNREILSGIRAVAAQREEVSIIAAAGWSSQDHVEAAMMWIISQREEAAEARKEDEARFSSERVDAEMMQRRKEEREKEMMSSDLQDLLGSVEGEIVISSKYFPHSVILQSGPTKQMFATLSSVTDSVKAARARKEVLRFLKLEKKATDWYGRVLPYSFFHHSVKSRFESWAGKLLQTSNGFSSDQISQLLQKEGDDLEKALYNLSEQEEGGVANVPKVFLQAERDAALKGLPTKETRDFDDEIEVLQHSSSKPSEKQQPVEVIEIS
eukprot:scaffold37697_cov176-Skeletonema_marinoi.AAC.1